MEMDKEELKKEVRNSTLDSWQERRDNSKKGRWTVKLIKRLDSWHNRKHGEVNYYLTQFLTGHGYFRHYLHKMAKIEIGDCIYCLNTIDNVRHTFFECNRWAEIRRKLELQLGELLSVETIIDSMLKTENNWNSVDTYVHEILTTKKLEDQDM